MARTITKRELVSMICAETHTRFTQKEVFDVIQKATELITEAMGRGDQVVLRRFGMFSVKTAKAKVGRNPKKPQTDIVIPTRNVVKFKMGKTLKELIRNAPKQ